MNENVSKHVENAQMFNTSSRTKSLDLQRIKALDNYTTVPGISAMHIIQLLYFIVGNNPNLQRQRQRQN